MARGSIITRTLNDGSKRYDTVIRIHGKQQWRTFQRKKEAEDWLDRHSTDIRDGTYREIRKATFGEYAEHWKQTHVIPENFKPSTLNSCLSVLERHITPELSIWACSRYPRGNQCVQSEASKGGTRTENGAECSEPA